MKRTAQIRRKNAKPPPKIKLPLKTMPRVTPSWVGRVPQLKPGRYADGLPIHQIEYVCCKLILQTQPLHVAPEPVRFQQGDEGAGRADRCGSHNEGVPGLSR